MNISNSKLKILLITGLFFSGFTIAQESFNASGGDASGSGGTVAYSVGQIVYTTHSGSNGTSAQGVQHAFEIFTVGIDELELDVNLTIFPNPTTDYLTLKTSDYNNHKLSYQLYDAQGKALSTGEIVSEQTKIAMNNLPTATYLVHVVDQENKKVHSFKIIKK